MQKIFCLVLFIISLLSCSQKNSLETHKYSNKLINESSPYLLQHAHNPVNWYPWGPTALEKAQKEDKLIIISVGYSACHWCHVMEKESFEDSLVAAIMNEHFVCIKVDREERPDIDDVYMSACHLSSGRSCGWPLNAFALPDGRPVWGGTYFPKDQWKTILNQFQKLKSQDQEKLNASADKLMEGMNNLNEVVITDKDNNFSKEELNLFTSLFLEQVDFEYGGKKGAPKFPMPNNYEYLLKVSHLTKNDRALNAVMTTLDHMAQGGIYDHLGGGFARYSVDEFWLVPHFEKMLYDNSQLISLYANAYQKTKSPLYKNVIIESIEFVKRELTDNSNGFYAALDADSEGEEGKFYVWTKEEIAEVIKDQEQFDLFCKYYDVSKKGNFEHKNILNVRFSGQKLASEFQLTFEEINEKLSESKTLLLAERSKRIRPGLDDKILTSWNALMIKAYADAYLALCDPDYLESGIKAADFILTKQMKSDGQLWRNFKNGKSSINAFLDDYALLISSFISLYQATFDEKWLEEAQKLANYTVAHFYTTEKQLFNYTSDLDPPLVVRKSEWTDNVIPGSNSVMAKNLFTLGSLLDNEDYKSISLKMLNNIISQIKESKQPNFYSNWCQLYIDQVYAPYEIAIIGKNALKKKMSLSQNYLANAILLGGKNEGSLSLLKDKLVEGDTKIYVCQNKVCKMPVSDVSKALKLLNY